MPNPCLFAICRTLQKDINSLIHMYYIFNYKIYRYQYFKEKRKCHYMGTTPTTTLKATPGITNLSHPAIFDKVTTGYDRLRHFEFLHSYFSNCLVYCDLHLSFVVTMFFILKILKNTK